MGDKGQIRLNSDSNNCLRVANAFTGELLIMYAPRTMLNSRLEDIFTSALNKQPNIYLIFSLI